MENKFRNEREIKIAGEVILLRPTFENILAMEQNVGSIMWFGHRFGQGKTVEEKLNKCIPTLTEAAQIVYYNQAATKPDDPTKKKLSLEEIWQLIQADGVNVISEVVMYIRTMTDGDKKPAVKAEEKKD